MHMTSRQRAFFNPTSEPDDYEHLLQQYVQLKLVLHHTRRSMYVDWYTEREDIDLLKARERCTELRELIRAKRRTIRFAAWGDLTPWEPTPYDRPILHAMEEHTCSFIVEENCEDTFTCPLQGRHWFHGKPYCRRHMRESRHLHNKKRTEQKAEAQNRRTWHRFVEPVECLVESEPEFKCPDCPRIAPHYHSFGRVHY